MIDENWKDVTIYLITLETKKAQTINKTFVFDTTMDEAAISESLLETLPIIKNISAIDEIGLGLARK